MKKIVLGIFCILLASGPALALRCGNKIVDVGDRLHKVQRLCGDPVFVHSYDLPILVYGYIQGYNHFEVWTYNFGRNRFMQELIFQNGVLRFINQLDYGY
ncbi:MAG: DUF2845 domain-containing protein [Methylococcaceae bacterium]|nr:DUF2845 domain-containing protein [Methylococcaceae bacterium]